MGKNKRERDTSSTHNNQSRPPTITTAEQEECVNMNVVLGVVVAYLMSTQPKNASMTHVSDEFSMLV